MRAAFLLLLASLLTESLAHAQSIRQVVQSDDARPGIPWASTLDSFIHAQDNFLKQKTPSALKTLLETYSEDIVVESHKGKVHGKREVSDDFDAYLRSILEMQKSGLTYRESRRLITMVSVDENQVLTLLETVGRHYHNTEFNSRRIRYDLASIKKIGSEWKIDYERTGAIDREGLKSWTGDSVQTIGNRLIELYQRGKPSEN